MNQPRSLTPTREPSPTSASDAAESLSWSGRLIFWGAIVFVVAQGASLLLTPEGQRLNANALLSRLSWMVATLVIANAIRAVLIGFGVLLTTRSQPPIEPIDSVAVGVDLRAAELAQCRQAIRGGQWVEAESLVRTWLDTHRDDPETTRLTEELASARTQARQEVLNRLDAARQAGDPDRVIELRDALKPLVDLDGLKTIDQDLARWFMTIIQRRLRAGTVRPDVAVLAGRVAQSLDDTPEGASLRASLPTLRRAAGLCARCAQPYKGVADACPACLTGVPSASPSSPILDNDDDDESDTISPTLDLWEP